MIEQIQPEPARRGLHEPAGLQVPPDPEGDQLPDRVQVKKEKRRWKVIAVSTLVALFLLLFGGGIFVGTASYCAYQLKEAQDHALKSRDASQGRSATSAGGGRHNGQPTRRFDQPRKWGIRARSTWRRSRCRWTERNVDWQV